MRIEENNVLVALINSKSDFEIAQLYRWYRIPVKSAPTIVKERKIKHIAFYHTKVFEKEKYSIRWYAPITKVSVVKRKELFPHLTADQKSEEPYYKIEFEQLFALPNPILSQRHRRILFISTTEEKLFNSTEINSLFNDSPIEEIFWQKLKEKHITAERQYYWALGENKFFLDFAVFCKTRNINIECDGDKYHTDKKNVYLDKKRNNILESSGWAVLRFTTYDITSDIRGSVNIVSDTINKYGGVEDISISENYKYIQSDDDQQLYLFD